MKSRPTCGSRPTARACGFEILVALFLAAMCGSCHRREHREIAGLIDTSDGVNEAEATAIADHLFSRFVGCGAHGDLHFAGTHWEVDTYLGVGGEAGPPVLIHAESGVVSWGPDCTIRNPELLFELDPPSIPCSRPDPLRADLERTPAS